jgi:hypothetical protein
MPAERITEKPDLSPVLGELEDEQANALTSKLAGADERLAALADTLNERGGVGFATEGVVLEREWSGQALIKLLVENEKRNVGFAAELRPQNFYGDEENPWQPGRPPMVMATDAWDVAGDVSVRFKTRVGGRPYTIQEQVVELTEKRYDDAGEAVDAFVAVCDRLIELALSKEPKVAGWKPDIPESVGAAPPIT